MTPLKSAYYCGSTRKLTGRNYSELSSMQHEELSPYQNNKHCWTPPEMNKKLSGEKETLRKTKPSEQALRVSLRVTEIWEAEWMKRCKPSNSSSSAPTLSKFPFREWTTQMWLLLPVTLSALIVTILQDSVPSTLLQRCIYVYFCHLILPHKNIPIQPCSESICFAHLIFVTWEVSIPSSTSNCWPGTHVSS